MSLLCLSACEAVFAAQAVETFPPEGRLVDVGGGRRLQVDCRGQGSPTILFQSGGDLLGSLAWKPVLEAASRESRACAYSRAGIMWSDPAKGPFRPEEVVTDLRTALDSVGEAPPFLLVGHSRGGLYNLLFAGRYPEDVAGLVFADASHPDQESALAQAGVALDAYVAPGETAALLLRWTGLLRLAPYPADPEIAERVRAYYPKSAAAGVREARARRETLEAAGQYRDLRNWPVVVLAREPAELTADRRAADARNAYLLAMDGLGDAPNAPAAEKVWRGLQADLAGWSSRGRLEIVPESTHAFFYYRPDVVLGAIREVLSAARVERRPAMPPQ